MSLIVPLLTVPLFLVGSAVGFAGMDALFGQPFLGKWWRKNK